MNQIRLKTALCMLLAFCILISGAMAGYEKLEKGDKNANVLNMQLALKSLGYDLEADGSFGAGTQKAVAQFQADQNLTADGVAGDKTLSRLYSLAPAFEPAGSITSSSSSSSSSSSTGTVPARVQTTGGTLTLRKSQSTSAAALKYIPNLTILAVSEKGSKWCKATYDGATGYVLTSYLNFSVASATVTPKPATNTGSNTVIASARVQTTGGTLTLRKTQSTSASALKYIPNLTLLSVYEKGTKWCKVLYDGAVGYVLTSYLNFSVASATATPTPTPATNTGSNTVIASARVQTTGGTLTLRKTQSTSAAALKYIPNLTLLSVYEKGTKWCKVLYDGAVGYVLTSYLNFSVASATATPTPTPATNTGSNTVIASARVQTTGGTLTLRKTQSTSASALKYIPNLTLLSVYEKDAKWCKVLYDGAVGYVLTSYLNFSVASATATPTPTPTATVPPSVSGLSATVKTSGGTLTLRKSQSTSAAALKYIPNKTVISVLATGDKWCQAVYDGATGYVLTSYLVFSGASVTQAPDTNVYTAYVKTSGGSLNLRESASTGARVLTEIPYGTLVAVTSKGTQWCRVVYGGYTGYVMTDYLSFDTAAQTPGAATATPTPTPTPTPSPTPESAYDTSIFTRVLRSGYTGRDVTLTQQRLQELSYLSSVSNVYDETTIAAVKQFQKLHNLTSDGLAGSSTFTILFSDSAMPYSGDLDSYEALHIYYGTVNTSQTAAVTKLQGALRDLGYSVSVTGKFDENTHNAVVQFQMRNNLTTDGVAGPSTQYLLYSGKAKGYSATPSLVLSDTDGMISGPSKSEIQLLHWYNVVKPALSGGSKLLIYDPNTGLSWTLRVYARGHHADSEPLTLKDTLIMNKAFGKTGWTVHAVYVQLPDGRWTMATMHNRPHLSGSISSNGFDGHLCVHFLRDMDECKKNDPNYGVSNQTTLRAAWKSLTGETVD